MYTLYIGNNITKFDHLSLNIRQNNLYYSISLKVVKFFRTTAVCEINTRNVRENGRESTCY